MLPVTVFNGNFAEPLPFQLFGQTSNVCFSENGRFALCRGFGRLPGELKRRMPQRWHMYLVDTACDRRIYGIGQPHKPPTNDGEVTTIDYSGITRFQTEMSVCQKLTLQSAVDTLMYLNNNYVLGVQRRSNTLFLRKRQCRDSLRQYQLSAEQTNNGFIIFDEQINARVNADGKKLFLMLGFHDRVTGAFQFRLLGVSDHGDGQVDQQRFTVADQPTEFGHFLEDQLIYRAYDNNLIGSIYMIQKIEWEPRMRLEQLRKLNFPPDNTQIESTFGSNVVLREGWKTAKFSIWRVRKPKKLLTMAHLAARDATPKCMWPLNPLIRPLLPAGSVRWKCASDELSLESSEFI